MAEEDKEFLGYYQKFKDKIFTYFWYRVNFNRTIAEDLTSEVFIRALTNFDSFDQTRSFQSWIYKIAHNHLVNYYRIHNREVELECAKNLSQGLSQIIANLELERVLKEIERLESYYREVLLLRFVDGLNNQEIAEALGKDEGAVRTQISRALQVIQEKLKAHNP